MKKRIQTRSVLIALLLLVLLLALTGCITSPNEVSSEEPLEETGNGFDNEPINATLLQAEPTGVWFMLSNGIGECVNESYPGSIVQITPGAPVPNISRMIDGEAEFVLTHNHATVSAVAGEEPYSEPHPEVMAVCAFYPSPAQLILRSDLEILTFDDIIDQQRKVKLTIGRPGGNAEEVFLRLLTQYGVTKEEMEAWGCRFYNKGQEETQQMFSDGAIDGYFLSASSPQPIIIENAINNDIMLAGFDPDVIQSMCDTYGFQKHTIAAGTYTFLESDYQSFGDYTILASSSAVSDETVYKLTKSICENLDYLTLVHAALKDLNVEIMAGKVKVPLHPGAERYYKEAGVL